MVLGATEILLWKWSFTVLYSNSQDVLKEEQQIELLAGQASKGLSEWTQIGQLSRTTLGSTSCPFACVPLLHFRTNKITSSTGETNRKPIFPFERLVNTARILSTLPNSHQDRACSYLQQQPSVFQCCSQHDVHMTTSRQEEHSANSKVCTLHAYCNRCFNQCLLLTLEF